MPHERDLNAWSLVFEGHDPGRQGLREALCTLGNGHFATRGAPTEASADGVHYPGTYLAGGYNRLTSRVAGREVENEDLVNLPNWLPLTVAIDDGPWYQPDRFELLDYRQVLHLRDGILVRDLRFRDAQGRVTRWHERRLTSMARCNRAGLCVDVTPENWSGRLRIQSAIDGNVANRGVERYRDLNNRHLEILLAEPVADDTLLVQVRTNQSRIEIAQAVRTRVTGGRADGAAGRTTVRDEGWLGQELALDVDEGAHVRIEKILALHASRDPAISEPGLAARETVASCGDFEALLDAHRTVWHQLWNEFDIEIESDEPDIALKLRLNTFHVLQTLSMHTTEYDTGTPARGWHGEAYRGHVFWDELFVFPLLDLRLPDVTRALLLYRYRRLPAAREAARRAGLHGAMFPWQSGSDGREESQRVHLNPRSGRWLPDHSRRQRHVNAAIAHNVWQYYQVTGDHEFMYFYGAELLVEIARFWAGIAQRDAADGRYHIRGVMGPDEYHTHYPGTDPERHGGIDDNAYTNIMAAWCLLRARDALDLLPDDSRAALCARVGLTRDEERRWEQVAGALAVPFHDDGIISQFAGYDALEEFDWDGYRERHGDVRRLDRILEAEGDSPNRFRVSKQADVLMLFYLFSADELEMLLERLHYPFDRRAIPRIVRYYLDRTSHGSTLSAVTHAWVMARSDRARSWDCFREALDSDIADIQGGTTAEGIHLGAMAGTLDLLHRCYLGLEMRGNTLYLDPAMPDPVRRLKVRLRYRRHKLDVEVTGQELRVTSRPLVAPPISVAYRGRARELSPGMTHRFRLVRAGREPPAETDLP